MANYNRKLNRVKRHNKLRNKLSGTSVAPRVSFFKSNKHIFVQAIDDVTGKTLASITDVNKSLTNINKSDISKNLGAEFAKKIAQLGIKKIVFDRGGYKYHGRVKAFADAMRSQNIEF